MWALVPVALLCAALCAVLALVLRAARATAKRERLVSAAQAARLAELEQLAARNAAILQSAMDGFFVLGEDYRFLEVNDAFCRMTGYTAGELVGMKMTDLEVSTPARQAGEATYWRTGLHHFATAHRHKDGHVIQLESCVVVLHDGGAKLLVGFTRDVTERCRAEEALRKSESQYRNLVETSRDLIWSLNLQGCWTFVNNAARTTYGYEPEEMAGRCVMEFVAPEHVADARTLLADIGAGKPRLRFETEHRRKDGAPVRLSFNGIAVGDEAGRVVGYTGTATDVTEQREAERRLRAAHARVESLVARMPLGCIEWSPDFRVQAWNPAAAAVFGYRSDEALGRRALDLVIPAEAQRPFTEMCRALLAGQAHGAALLVNRKRDGERIRCEWYNTVLPDAGGAVQGVVTLVRDVSERERLEAQLRQAQKLESLGVLAGGVAHDFNNLLVGILGNASLALEKLPEGAPVRGLLERVVNAGRRATDLTQRMLAYAGRTTCDVQIMDLSALVQEMAEFAAAGIPKRVTVQIHTQPDLPLIKADSGQMQQVIMNLLINAAEAIGDDGGAVTVSTRLEELDGRRAATEFPEYNLTPGPYVCLEVQDTGCGMSAETLGRIFDPFFSTKFAGRGLGLSAMLGIVRAHRGAVRVTSQEGVGTVFHVLVPAAEAAALPKGPGAAPRVLPRGSTVLVIDDEEDIRDVVQSVLEHRGLHVLAADDGQRGLAVFQQHAERIDAVLLDMNMPGMSGEAVFAELQRIKPGVKVLVSTGFSEQEAAERFADVPLAGFVHKPYTATALVDKIGAALTGCD
jgi:PAS domain S-box-containing protein